MRVKTIGQWVLLMILCAGLAFLMSDPGREYRGALLRWLGQTSGPKKALGLLVCRDGKCLADSEGHPLKPRNNPQARNASWAEVRRFLEKCDVSAHPYQLGKYVCTEYARDLHDAAEAAGLRCAVVYVAFEVGDAHTLNAFETTDEGLVYVDCTGSEHARDSAEDFKTVGYLQAGREYGRLALAAAEGGLGRYEHYREVMKRWEDTAAEREQIAREQETLTQAHEAWEKREKELKATLTRPANRAEQLKQNAAIEALNQQARSLQLQVSNLNARIQAFNQNKALLNPAYRINNTPVKWFDLWW